MPQVNPLARELVFKVVYYGPGLGGKTTSLQHVHATTRPEHRGKMVSLATPVDRTLYFDFLPIRVPTSRNMTIRLQLFTVPGQVYYNATRKLVLTGADGVVFVADSQLERADANVESFRNLEENLLEHGRSLDEMPHIFAYNKRDLEEVCPIDEMERQLNLRGAPSFATVAPNGEGVYEALEAITRAVLEDFDQRVPEHRGLSPSPLMLPEGGLAEALRLVDRPSAGPVALAQPSAPIKRDAGLDFGLAMATDEDVGEQAARYAVESGTSPGLGLKRAESESPIALNRTKAAPNRVSLDSVNPSADDPRWERAPSSSPESFEPAAQSHFRPLPVPLEGVGMRSTPPPVEVANVRSNVREPTSTVSPVLAARGATKTRDSDPEASSAALNGCSLAILWPAEEFSTVGRAEQAILADETRDAVMLAAVLVDRCLEELGSKLGRPGTDSLLWLSMLGLSGAQYFEFARLVELAKSGQAEIGKAEALGALVFATHVCREKLRALAQS